MFWGLCAKRRKDGAMLWRGAKPGDKLKKKKVVQVCEKEEEEGKVTKISWEELETPQPAPFLLFLSSLSLTDSNKAISHKQVLFFNRDSFNTCLAVQPSEVHFITGSD